MFSIRKQIRKGPVRINISKSGIGFSFGIPGLMLSIGPRGVFYSAKIMGMNKRGKINLHKKKK